MDVNYRVRYKAIFGHDINEHINNTCMYTMYKKIVGIILTTFYAYAIK